MRNGQTVTETGGEKEKKIYIASEGGPDGDGGEVLHNRKGK